jgi:predicted RNase H-like nuclease (RuvC/YqgF family)
LYFASWFNSHHIIFFIYFQCKSLIEQKETQLTHASERIIALEKRLKSNSMTGDDLAKALAAERDKLEKQLDEARKHAAEMKVTYSNHCNHLEGEVARLNKKVVEEREERERSKRDGQKMVENLQMQASVGTALSFAAASADLDV